MFRMLCLLFVCFICPAIGHAQQLATYTIDSFDPAISFQSDDPVLVSFEDTDSTQFAIATGNSVLVPLSSDEIIEGFHIVDVEFADGGVLAAIPVVVVQEPDDPPPPAHRGRIQIQGPDMNPEVSWAWAQDTPPTKAEGLAQLDALYNGLTDKQKTERAGAYAKARVWIRGLPVGGVDAQVSKTWGGKKKKSNRIDIEVIKGKAFTGADPEASDDEETEEVFQ